MSNDPTRGSAEITVSWFLVSPTVKPQYRSQIGKYLVSFYALWDVVEMPVVLCVVDDFGTLVRVPLTTLEPSSRCPHE